MKRNRLNVKYITGKPARYVTDLNELMPSTQAIAWCMTHTEVARLFSEEDMREFLYRLPILFHLRELVEDWLMEGTLFNYIWKGREHTLTVQDLAMHFGLEAYDHYLNVTPRDRFLKRVPWSRCFPLDVGYSMNFEHLRIDGTRLVVHNVIYAPDVTPQLLAKADFFSRDVMKFMSESGLRDGNVRFRNKQSELEKRRAIIDSLSCFDLARVPAEILSSCLDKLFPGSQNNLILESPSDADSINRFARPMLFIGWVWANYFTNDDGSFLPGKETFTRDYLDYEEEDGAQVLTYNVELHIIEELVPLLRGIRQLQNI